jgi:tight adherence protein C
MIPLLTVVLLAVVTTRQLRPLLVQRRAQRLRNQMEARGLPGVVVLLQIAAASGQSPRQAVRSVRSIDGVSGALGVAVEQLAILDDRLLLGADFGEAMLAMDQAGQLRGATARVLDVLRRGEHDGAPLHLHLEVLLHDLRRHRATELDTAAQKLTVSMLFPLVICILPAFILLAVVPLVQSALAGLPGT